MTIILAYIANSNCRPLVVDGYNKEIHVNIEDDSTNYDHVIEVRTTQSNQSEITGVENNSCIKYSAD